MFLCLLRMSNIENDNPINAFVSAIKQLSTVDLIDETPVPPFNGFDKFAVKTNALFMSSALLSLASNETLFEQQNSAPIYYNLSTLDGTTIVPFLYVVSLSTNVDGYGVLSTFSRTAFSTFSTSFPFLLGSATVYNLNVVNENLSSLASIFNVTTAGLQSTIDYYNTSVEASSLSSLIFQSPSTFK